MRCTATVGAYLIDISSMQLALHLALLFLVLFQLHPKKFARDYAKLVMRFVYVPQRWSALSLSYNGSMICGNMPEHRGICDFTIYMGQREMPSAKGNAFNIPVILEIFFYNFEESNGLAIVV